MSKTCVNKLQWMLSVEWKFPWLDFSKVRESSWAGSHDVFIVFCFDIVPLYYSSIYLYLNLRILSFKLSVVKRKKMHTHTRCACKKLFWTCVWCAFVRHFYRVCDRTFAHFRTFFVHFCILLRIFLWHFKTFQDV